MLNTATALAVSRRQGRGNEMPRQAPNEDYGSFLRRERRARGLTQRQLATRVGVDFTYVSKVENGRLPVPSEATITQLAKALGSDAETHLATAKKLPVDMRSRYETYPAAATRLVRALSERRLSSTMYEQLLRQVERAKTARSTSAPGGSSARIAGRRSTTKSA